MENKQQPVNKQSINNEDHPMALEEILSIANKLKEIAEKSDAASSDKTPSLAYDAKSEHSINRQFAYHIHQYIREYIKFADQKSAFVFAFSSAVLALLYKQSVHLSWFQEIDNWSVFEVISLLSVILLIVGMSLCVFVVFPRLKRTHRGFVFFGSICEFESASEYAVSISSESKDSLLDNLLRHNYDLSKICRSKYTILYWGFWINSIGVLLSIIFLLFSQ